MFRWINTKISQTLQILLIGSIKAYRFILRPLLGSNQCRFSPSCSQYALEAVTQYGPMRGAWLSVKRILRCHPWHPGGFDPIVEKDENK